MGFNVSLLRKTLHSGASESSTELLSITGSLIGILMLLTFTHKFINSHYFEWKEHEWRVKQQQVTENILKWKLTDRIRKDSFRENRGTGERSRRRKRSACCFSYVSWFHKRTRLQFSSLIMNKIRKWETAGTPHTSLYSTEKLIWAQY